MRYIPPSFEGTAYNCPHCGAYAKQDWNKTYISPGAGFIEVKTVRFAFCTHCKNYTIWHNEKMNFPNTGNAPMPNPDLPPEIIEDYEEARNILHQSPRGAAALLRLAIQKLCKQLGEKGKNINDDIANLVKKGLSVKIQQALDVVRVVGNQAVHPGQIDLKDGIDTATKLFDLVNIIADVMISQPKQIDSLYSSLPQSQKDAITKRDGEK